MQQAIPYKSWQPFNPLSHTSISRSNNDRGGVLVSGGGGGNNVGVSNMVSENAVIVFAKRGCCMSHVVKRLLLGLGVNPSGFEVDDDDEGCVLEELQLINNKSNNNGGDDEKLQLPAVFIGGKLFGGLDRIMATHISGELIPVLKEAKALWL